MASSCCICPEPQKTVMVYVSDKVRLLQDNLGGSVEWTCLSRSL